jgi:RNA polymerase sigma-70 factor (ECF subfamily)
MSKRTNEQWINDLRSNGDAYDSALTDLRAVIQHGLPYALNPYLSPTDPRFGSLVEEVTQETILRVIDRLDTFEGRSQFTTWVHKIAIRLALTELRRKRWENVSLESLLENPEHAPPIRLAADPSPTPEIETEVSDMMAQVQEIIREELTEKQRTAIELLAFHGMPMEETARRLDTNRNALYKLLHDTRLRIKNRLRERGLTIEEVLSVFNEQ